MNGPSNIMMLMVTYIMFGIYTVAFNKLDAQMYESSMHTAKSIQSEQIAASGMAIASATLGTNQSISNFVETMHMNSGMSTVTATRIDASTMKVTSISNYYEESSTRITTFAYYNGRWRAIRTYVI